jgi:hypothetical protein
MRQERGRSIPILFEFAEAGRWRGNRAIDKKPRQLNELERILIE